MSLFAISDLHLSFGVDKPMDIFGERWVNAAQRLETNWKAAVTPEDTVVLAGDLSWGMSMEEALADLRFIDSLPGTKILLKGNHDYWWNTLKKLNDALTENSITTLKFLFNNAYSVDGFAVCGTRGWNIFGNDAQDNKLVQREVLRLRESCRLAQSLGGEMIAFLHYPPVSHLNECRAFSDVLQEFGVKRCYYGHIHHKGMQRAFTGDMDGIEYTLLSADVVDFCPVPIIST